MRFKVKERREKVGITQRELAERSGVCRAALSLIENGKETDIKLSTLISLSKVLRCSPLSLVE